MDIHYPSEDGLELLNKLQGLEVQESQGGLRISTLNINSLTSFKTQAIASHMNASKSHIIAIIDTRHSMQNMKTITRVIEDTLPGAQAIFSSIPNVSAPSGASIILLHPDIKSSLTGTQNDPTGLGLILSTKLKIARFSVNGLLIKNPLLHIYRLIGAILNNLLCASLRTELP